MTAAAARNAGLKRSRMSDLEHAPAGRRGLHERRAFGDGRGERLLDQHVDAGSKEVEADRGMGAGRDRDARAIDGTRERVVIGEHRDAERGRDLARALGIAVDDAHEAHARQRRVLLGMKSTQMADADHGGAQLRHPASPLAPGAYHERLMRAPDSGWRAP